MSEAADGAGFPDGTPMRLGRYRLVRPISTGGMAHVFEARRDSIAGVSPRVAIKVILPHFAADLGFRELFVNEARVGSLLHHQNLVQIQDFDSEGDRYFIVMEYVEGFTLRRAISLYKRSGLRLSLSTVAEIGRQVCDGLHHAHAACSEGGQHLHLVHRDVKPRATWARSRRMVWMLGLARTSSGSPPSSTSSPSSSRCSRRRTPSSSGGSWMRIRPLVVPVSSRPLSRLSSESWFVRSSETPPRGSPPRPRWVGLSASWSPIR
jgi:hypothetical protein